MEAVMAPYKEALEDKLKVAKQSKITCFFTKFTLPCIIHSTSNTMKTGTLASLQ
jgi:hypothetical protein